MAALNKDGVVPVDVTWQDQQRICTFSRVHRRLQHLLKRRKAIDDDLEKIDDASTEIMVVDDALMEESALEGHDNIDDAATMSRIKFVFGEAFVDVDADRCGELLDDEKDKLAEDRATIAVEIAELESALEELKVQLKAKFGNQIYLEDK